MHYAESECAMPIRLHCNELRALCLTTNALCRTADIGALLLKCVLIVYISPEKGVVGKIFAHWVIDRHHPDVLNMTRTMELRSGVDFAHRDA